MPNSVQRTAASNRLLDIWGGLSVDRPAWYKRDLLTRRNFNTAKVRKIIHEVFESPQELFAGFIGVAFHKSAIALGTHGSWLFIF